jgi:signal transduction histidine kinase
MAGTRDGRFWTERLRPDASDLELTPSGDDARSRTAYGHAVPGRPRNRDIPISASPWRSERAAFWARSLRVWDIAFYALWALGVAAYLVNQPHEGSSLAIGLPAFAVLLVAYLTIGRRAAVTGSNGLALTYLVIMFACVTVVVSADETGTLLLFLAYSQVWYYAANRRAGVVLTVVLTVLVFTALGLGADLDGARDVASLVTQGAIAVAFSVLLGLWVTQVAEQSEERADLLARLEEAQADAAASHHSAGVMAERERMSREIHDTLAQGFTSVIMLAQTAAADLRRDQPAQAVDRLTLIERTARENLAEARALVAAAAPVGLEESSLIEALTRLARRFGQETGVRVRVVADDDALAGLPREREVVLLRAAQEALSNVRRHARTSNVDLVLAVGTDADRDVDPGAGVGADSGAGAEVGTGAGAGTGAGQAAGSGPGTGVGSVRLEVVDDGQGMDPTAVEGFGLRGMRDRVTSEGGWLAVSSDVGQGTRVQVTLPSSTQDDERGLRPDVAGEAEGGR